jgi:hypothetical protein
MLDAEFDVFVFIAGAEDLAAFQFTMEYDEAYLELVSIDVGPFLGTSEREVYVLPPVLVPGSIAYSAITLPEEGTSGATGDGDLAIVRFRSLALGETEIALKDVLLEQSDGDKTEIDGQNTTVTITDQEPTPTGEPPTEVPPTETPDAGAFVLHLPWSEA